MNIRVFACLALLTLGVVGCGDNPTTPRPPPPTVYNVPYISIFSANPTEIKVGECSNLFAQVENVMSISIDNGIGMIWTTPTGWAETARIAKRVCPVTTTIYVLTATNGAGKSSTPVTVAVK
jgi:hypothetical protein